MRSPVSRRRILLVGMMFVVAVSAVIVLGPGEPVCVGESSGTLTEEKLETGDLLLVYWEFDWFSPYLSPIYVFNMETQVVSRMALDSEHRGGSDFEFALEQRLLTAAETQGLRQLLIAEGLDEWPEYVNPKGYVDGFQWHFETWEGDRLLQSTVFDNVEPRCAENVLQAMSDLLEEQSSRFYFETGDVFTLYQARSIEEMLRSADSLIEIEPSPSARGGMRVGTGSESSVSLRSIRSEDHQLIGAVLRIDEPLLLVVDGHERQLLRGDLFGVVSPYSVDTTLHFVIDDTIDNGIVIVLRETAEGWVGEVTHLGYAGITVIGEVRLESID